MESLTRCLKQAAQGLKFLHSLNIAHCNMDSMRILQDLEGNWKISDFTYARSVISSGEDCLYQIDLEMFGWNIFEICYIVRNHNEYGTMKKDLYNKSQFPKENKGPISSPAMDNIIKRLLKRDGNITLDEVIEFFDKNL